MIIKPALRSVTLRRVVLFFIKAVYEHHTLRCSKGSRTSTGDVPFSGGWVPPIAGALTPPSANDNKQSVQITKPALRSALLRRVVLFFIKAIYEHHTLRCSKGSRTSTGDVPFSGGWVHPIAGALTPPSANDNK
jgi:predicted transcriptional regulator with HTH domain